jgi:hypothetical protein
MSVHSAFFNQRAPSLATFLKFKTNGIVAAVITAETAKTNPLKPIVTPKENTLGDNIGATVWASAAIAQAAHNVPPCVCSDVLKEIKVLSVTYLYSKTKEYQRRNREQKHYGLDRSQNKKSKGENRNAIQDQI